MDRKHFKCFLWKVLWGLGFLSLVAAWLSLKSSAVFGFDAAIWFWNALIFAALSISIKLDCHACDVCGISPRV
ncbi:MAG: hypothetical protein AAB474_01605 [Patescibacteria group bacterium]